MTAEVFSIGADIYSRRDASATASSRAPTQIQSFKCLTLYVIHSQALLLSLPLLALVFKNICSLCHVLIHLYTLLWISFLKICITVRCSRTLSVLFVCKYTHARAPAHALYIF